MNYVSLNAKHKLAYVHSGRYFIEWSSSVSESFT